MLVREVLTVYTSTAECKLKVHIYLYVFCVILGCFASSTFNCLCACDCARVCVHVCVLSFLFFQKAVLFYIRLNESYATNHLRLSMNVSLSSEWKSCQMEYFEASTALKE